MERLIDDKRSAADRTDPERTAQAWADNVAECELEVTPTPEGYSVIAVPRAHLHNGTDAIVAVPRRVSLRSAAGSRGRVEAPPQKLSEKVF